MCYNASKKFPSQVKEVVITTDNNEDHHHHLGRVVVCVGLFDGPMMISPCEDTDYDNDNDNETNNDHVNHYFNKVSALDLEYAYAYDDNKTEDMTTTTTSHLTSLVQLAVQ